MEGKSLYLTNFEVATAIGISTDMLDELIEAGVLPAGHPVGKRKKLWSANDVPAMAWLMANHHRLSRGEKPEIKPKSS